MAYNRKVQLKAGDSTKGLLISNLHIDFEVQRSRDFTANIAKLRIYNPSETTINNILKEGNSIVLEAGYEDEGIGVIYIGQITSSVPTNNGVDTIVYIESNTLQGSEKNQQTLEPVTLSLSYAPGTSTETPLKEIANILGLATYGIENIADLVLANGYVFVGKARDALRYCRSIVEKEGFIVYIDNDTIIVSSEANPTEVTTTSLRQETGLLNASKLNTTAKNGKKDSAALSKRVTFTSILNPQITPNKHVEIDNKRDVVGKYVVDKCTFMGSNWGNKPYTVTGEAIGG